ncbi:hypothetical protein H3Z85_04430 [Chryseobacterium indologenes]|uniref:hypothetical protein n=1 Tax=Chryseobacterium indologenes TaxID=253 RepID=UPI0003E0824A|nr:hypothetical protein [Chryseobacterium indologenes]QPQ52695.1 hypothetical protein H3Z85_04430 [Chryseobacterium indologenes]GAE65407.1 hypothetical protein CIN01S_11_00430 [Chryseobacterium indologenes NBRC 14944]SFK12905.1 hypothetical protein SAMN05421692_3465 [Chryseobacterium indologenes]SUX51409.1 Uncharacterised protein [Chryseobacterium indologenes]
MNPILIEFYFDKTLPIFPVYRWNYEKYQKIYSIESFDINFENEVFNVFKRPLQYFYKESIPGDFFASNVLEVNESELAFHAEFDNVLFFYLYSSIRTYLESFYEIIEANFSEYRNDIGNYRVPIYFYNDRYTYIKQNHSIFQVFKFLIETRTNTIERIDDDMFINIFQIKNFEEQFKKYNFI